MESVVARQNSTRERFNYIVSRIDDQYHQMAVFFGISNSAFNVLYVLYQLGGSCRQSALTENLGISRKTINSSLQKMAGEGLLTIEKGQGRSTKVELTDRGRDCAERIIVPVIAAENSLFETWTQEERDQFLRLNQRYLSQIRERFEEIRSREQERPGRV